MASGPDHHPARKPILTVRSVNCRRKSSTNLDTFYTEAVEGGLYDPEWRRPQGGQGRHGMVFRCRPARPAIRRSLKIEDFWYLAPLDAATRNSKSAAGPELSWHGPPPPVRASGKPRSDDPFPDPETALRRLIVFGAWEIAGRIPVSYAFPDLHRIHAGALSSHDLGRLRCSPPMPKPCGRWSSVWRSPPSLGIGLGPAGSVSAAGSTGCFRRSSSSCRPRRWRR